MGLVRATARLPREQVTQTLAAERPLAEIVRASSPEPGAMAPVVKRPKARPGQHGAAMLNRALAHMPQLDPSLPIVRRVRHLERDLTRQLGGRQSLTTAERLLVHQAAVKVVICGAMESWILREPK